MYFSQFCSYHLLEKGEALHLDKLECLSPKDALYVASLDEIGQVVLENFLKNFVNVVLLFCNYLPLEKGGALHLYKLESRQPRMHCCKFGWIWPSGSGKQDFFISSMYIRYFVIISPWKRAWPFISVRLKDENVKSLQQRQQWQRRRKQRWTTDKFWWEKL